MGEFSLLLIPYCWHVPSRANTQFFFDQISGKPSFLKILFFDWLFILVTGVVLKNRRSIEQTTIHSSLDGTLIEKRGMGV